MRCNGVKSNATECDAMLASERIKDAIRHLRITSGDLSPFSGALTLLERSSAAKEGTTMLNVIVSPKSFNLVVVTCKECQDELDSKEVCSRCGAYVCLECGKTEASERGNGLVCETHLRE